MKLVFDSRFEQGFDFLPRELQLEDAIMVVDDSCVNRYSLLLLRIILEQSPNIAINRDDWNTNPLIVSNLCLDLERNLVCFLNKRGPHDLELDHFPAFESFRCTIV